MTLSSLLEHLKPSRIIGYLDPNAPVLGLTDHSANLQPGVVFFARQGAVSHGKLFIDQAMAKGASCIVLEDAQGIDPKNACLIEVPQLEERLPAFVYLFYGNPQARLRLIGITGTNGKTTTACLIQGMLSFMGEPCAYLGTLGFKGRPDEAFRPIRNTTPGIFEMSSLLNDALKGGSKTVAMEVSSHALCQGRVRGLSFDLGLFLNLTHDHLDFHGSMEAYFKAKKRLFEDYLAKGGLAVINTDDPYGQKLYSELGQPKALSFGLFSAQADLKATGVQTTLGGTAFDLFWRKEPLGHFQTPLIGFHNVSNVLGAFGVLRALGYDIHPMKPYLETLPQIPGRLERIVCPEGGPKPWVFVDYAHTPDAVWRVLSTLKGLSSGRLIGVLGCGGDRDPSKRPLMGRMLAELCDLAVLTQDNPRNEDPMKILMAMEEGAKTLSKSIVGDEGFVSLQDRKEAIEYAIKKASPKDTVAILGKGHEDYQLVRGIRYPFDDRVVAKQALQNYQPTKSYALK